MLRRFKGESLSSEEESDSYFPPTYIVIEFSSKIKPETAQWLVDKISKERKKGGGDLIVRSQPLNVGKNLTVHVTCGSQQLLELAEELEIRKRDRHGVLREFTMHELDDFINPSDKAELLSSSEKQTIVRHELENIRALNHEICILSYPEYPLYEGQSILSACLHYGIIKQIYPLHDEAFIRKLGSKWYSAFLSPQPYEDIRIYFGESITLYFQFLGFYTRSLIVPMLLGFLQMLLPSSFLPFFCILNIICASMFLEFWRRKCSELAYIWGTITMTSFDEPRANFRGHMGIDAVTGKLLPQAPRFQTHMKMYCVSLPLVVLCMIGAFFVMLIYFWVEDHVKQIPDVPNWFINVPGVVYAILVYVMNLVYRKFATFLTEWENHRTQSQFDRHRVTKLVLFEFVNNFMSLFYVAFIIQDIALLRYQLATLLIVLQAINNIQEAFIPLILRRFFLSESKTSKTKIEKSGKTRKANIELVGIKEIEPTDSRLDEAVSEGRLDVYEDPYDDYLELFVQFGYVFLFSAVYPMAAFWAFANNCLEIRTDAFKLCRIYQRPMARKVKDIGAWQRSFQAICALSVMTNCALLSTSPSLRAHAPDMSSTKWYLMFVLLEHLLLAARQILHYAIPDKPEWVRVALAKGNYKAKQALKQQRASKSRRKNLSNP
ncbi:Anoctamin [Nesidiocoris tenuis]|uniref:Anoctamin n=2 Tax=Nesidiocoris tenuis TaxID=355587 RepID=A0ABN7B6L4_9HEMI|nr:Anoctamin [Nesidiocoris tenuis]